MNRITLCSRGVIKVRHTDLSRLYNIHSAHVTEQRLVFNTLRPLFKKYEPFLLDAP